MDERWGLGITNPVGTGGVFDVCLCFGCGGVGGVGGECVGVLRGGVVLCMCELSVWILCVDGRSRCCGSPPIIVQIVQTRYLYCLRSINCAVIGGEPQQ